MDLTGYIIAFDLDGTLVDTAPDIIGALNLVLREEGITPYNLDEARPLIGRGALELLRRGFALARHPLSPDQEKPLFDRLIAHYWQHLTDFSRPFEGVTEALDALKARGARLAVCTNKLQDLSVAVLTRLELIGYFESVRGADSVPARKPDAGHLKACIEDMGGSLAKSLLVGDSETDFKTSRNAGVPSILVSFGYSEGPVGDIACDVLITHYDELIMAVEKVIK